MKMVLFQPVLQKVQSWEFNMVKYEILSHSLQIHDCLFDGYWKATPLYRKERIYVHLHTCACVFAEKGDDCLQSNSSFLPSNIVTRGGCQWNGHNCRSCLHRSLQHLATVCKELLLYHSYVFIHTDERFCILKAGLSFVSLRTEN